MTHRQDHQEEAVFAQDEDPCGPVDVSEHNPANPACDYSPERLRLTDAEKATLTPWITRNYGRAFDAVERIIAARIAAQQADAPDLLASFRAYVRAAENEHRALVQYWRGNVESDELHLASAAERTAREAHETALRAVGER